MKFIALVVVIEDKHEEEVIKVAKEAGAGSVTVTHGRSIGLEEKKVFFGLTLEENVSLLLFLLPKRTSLKVMRTIREKFDFSNPANNGMAFSFPLSHVVGLDMDEIQKFENDIRHIL